MGFFQDLISPTKYNLPKYNAVDVGEEQLATTRGNYASFEAAKKLAEDYNTFMRGEVSKGLQESVPEFSGLESKMASNLMAKLKGELPADVAGAVKRGAAATALGKGVAGSQAGFNITARDLGRSSLDLSTDAESRVPGFLSTMTGLKRAPMFDFSSTFLSPSQRISAAFENESNRWNVANMKAQMDAQPEPWQKAFAGLGDQVIQAAIGYFGGGMLSGGAGAGNWSAGMLSSSAPKGWGSTTPFDRYLYLNSVYQGKMAGAGMNFE